MNTRTRALSFVLISLSNAFQFQRRSGLKAAVRFNLIPSGSFDFSSTAGWNQFYKDSQEGVIEWHASVPFTSIAKHIPKDSSCLIIGCGNSELPRFIHDNVHGSQVVCLDSSIECIKDLTTKHHDRARMRFVCGDATQLTEVLSESSAMNSYDVVIDKGLIDAILCGEGWNTPVVQVLQGASNVLNTGGIYLLISYCLPRSTKDFLEQRGQDFGLAWTFDLPESNKRVGLSMARKV